MLTHVLAELMQRPRHHYTPALLSRLSGVPKPTIVNWLTGRVVRPRRWHELLLVAAALRLDTDDADQVLAAAGYPPLVNLQRQTHNPDELRLLRPWLPALPTTALAPLAPPRVPTPTTPLIDRVDEYARIRSLLGNPAVRLVSLTGTAGVGKTRLALHIAADLSRAYADGSYVAPLATVTDPTLLLPTLAQTLLAEPPAEPCSVEQLGLAIQHRRLLLVLDNCEHLPHVGPLISRLLAVAPGVTVLVTSRCMLHVAGEHEIPLEPLALPDLQQLPPLDQLAQIPAVALFLARMRALRPDFQLTDTNELLARTRQQWGRQVRHIWDRGFAGTPWLFQVLETDLRFVLRWPKRYKLLDPWGEPRKAWEIARGKRAWSSYYLYDPKRKEQRKASVLAISVTHPEHARPLWLVVARLKGSKEPWYLLTSDVIRTAEDVWGVVRAYARRWQIEQTWRYTKSELGCESPRVWAWERREKFLLMLTLVYAFLLSLLVQSLEPLREACLRWGCHRTGKRSRAVAAPLYRLRAAISRLLGAHPGTPLMPSLSSG